jgi:hypothetical protein
MMAQVWQVRSTIRQTCPPTVDQWGATRSNLLTRKEVASARCRSGGTMRNTDG